MERGREDRGRAGASPTSQSSQLTSQAVPLYGTDGHIRPLHDIREDIILLAVASNPGRIDDAARQLRIGTTTLYRWARSHSSGRRRSSIKPIS